MTENQGLQLPGNITGMASRAFGPVDPNRWNEAGNTDRLVRVVHLWLTQQLSDFLREVVKEEIEGQLRLKPSGLTDSSRPRCG